ncbi:hypothetical protein GNI_128700 [Gregarina niphandrodes]|uniref:Uncharacterized protein n=1 Tax=Gregarina niphandrodes TaxID=110365 RepID=A0A023B1R2_GRENI|nr:hypothetical protein GNI_128700 [Gregarina niphandrodes]EZG48587.1 hypothetical protein GNI_128700 [Gregarina niphandrodes]|eukprot:XP_011132091.1 hypothetical protein GNI_128700 [Gregarina niphandrodes]
MKSGISSSSESGEGVFKALCQCLADYLHVTVGHTVGGPIPTFTGNELTVTAVKNTEQNLGYALGLVVDGGSYKTALLKEIEARNKTLPLPAGLYTASRLLLFMYVNEEADAVTKASEQAWQSSSLSAIAINLDWLERLGQSAAIEHTRLNPVHFANLVSTRHLHYEVDVASLIAAGAAVKYQFHTPAQLTFPLSDQFKVVMDYKMFDESFESVVNVKEWIQNDEGPDSYVAPRFFKLPARPGTVIGLPRGDSEIVEASAFWERDTVASSGDYSWPELNKAVDSVKPFQTTAQIADEEPVSALSGMVPTPAVEKSHKQTQLDRTEEVLSELLPQAQQVPPEEEDDRSVSGSAQDLAECIELQDPRRFSGDLFKGSGSDCDDGSSASSYGGLFASESSQSGSSIFGGCPDDSLAAAVMEETVRAWDYTYGVSMDRLAHIRKAKILGRGLTNWRTTRTKDLGMLTTTPEEASRPATMFGVLTHMAMKVASYRASYSDFSFWSAVEIACSLMVNIIFGFLG